MFKHSTVSLNAILGGVAACLLLIVLVVFFGLGTGGTYAPTQTLPEGVDRDAEGSLTVPDGDDQTDVTPINDNEDDGHTHHRNGPRPPEATTDRGTTRTDQDDRRRDTLRRARARLLDDPEIAWPEYPTLQLEPSPAAEQRGERFLDGTLTDTRRTALAGAQVHWRPSEGEPPVTVLTRDDGGFQLRGLPDQPVDLWSHAPHHLPARRSAVEPGDGGGDGEEEGLLALEAQRFGVLVGRVLGRDGDRLRDFTVSFRYLGEGRPAVADTEELHEAGEPIFPDPFEPQPGTIFRYTFRDVESGRFGIYLGVGRFEVHVHGEETEPRNMVVTIDADDVQEATFRLAQRTTIQGRVYLDDDFDFPAVANAMVSIRDARGGELTNQGLTTDAEGRFEAVVLYQGEATVIVTHMSYKPINQTIEIQSGGTQLLEFALSPGQIVTGTVTDAEGQPVEDLTVWVRPRDEAQYPPGVVPPRPGELSRRGFVIGDTTDADGRYRAYGLEPGQWVLVTENAHGYYETHVPFETVEEERTTVVNAQLTRGVNVKITVEVANGRLPAEAFVFLHRDGDAGATQLSAANDPDYHYSPARDFYTYRTVESDERHVVLEGVYPGTYRARVTHDAVRTNQKRVEIREAPLEQSLILHIELGDTLTGVVLNADHEPVPGARIAWYSLRDHDAARRATSDQQGRFEVAGVVSGPSLLVVDAQEYREWSKEVEIGTDLPHLEVVLDAGATLRGRLLSPDGVPYPRGQVILRDRERGDGIQDDRLPEGVVVGRRGPVVGSVSGGEFRITGLEPGEYNVQIRGTEYYWPSDQTVYVSAPETSRDFHLERGARLRGSVSGPGGETIGRSVVQLLRPEANIAGTIDPEYVVASATVAGGQFDMRGFPGGSYVLVVDVPHYLPYVQRLDVFADVRHDVVLESGYAIAGHVRDDQGEPLGASLNVRPLDDGLRGSHGRTGSGGAYRVTGLHPGRYMVQVIDQRTQMVIAEREVTLGDSDMTGVDFVATRHATFNVRGTVVDAEGQPQSNLTLSLSHAEQSGVRQVLSTGVGGNFQFRNLAPGTYRVNATTRTGATLEPTWTLTVDEEDIQDLELIVESAVNGARLVHVQPGSSAHRAELRTGDIVTSWDGTSVRSVHDLRTAASDALRQSGDNLIEVRASRNGSPVTTYVERKSLDALGIRLR